MAAFSSVSFTLQRLPIARLTLAAVGTSAAALVTAYSFPPDRSSPYSKQTRPLRRPVFTESLPRPHIQEVLRSHPLTKNDEARVLAALNENIEEAFGWIGKPASWWTDTKIIHIKSHGDITIRSTTIPGYDCRLFVGQTVFQDTTWDELNVVVELREDCVKIQKDKVMKGCEKLADFGVDPKQLQVEVLRQPMLMRLHSNPNLCGLISAREIDDWTVQWRLTDGRVAESSCGLHSKRMAKHAEDSFSLQAMIASSASNGYVRTDDHNSGLLIEPLDAEAIAGSSGAWRVSYYALTDVNGKIPAWAAREGTKRTQVDYLTFCHRELSEMRSRR